MSNIQKQEEVWVDSITIDKAYETFSEKVAEVSVECATIDVIEDDSQNSYARDVATKANMVIKGIDKLRKEYNKPYQNMIKENNAYAKEITTTLTLEVDRIKMLIGSYEKEKEKERLAELARIEQEKRNKEKAEYEERVRIVNIRNHISTWKAKMLERLNLIRTTNELLLINEEVKATKALKKDYGDQVELMKTAIKEVKESIKDKKKFIADLEKREKDVKVREEEFKKLLEEQKKQQLRDQQIERQKEFRNKQLLITLLAQLHSEFADWTIEEKKDELIAKYGSATEIMANREQIIEDEQRKQEEVQILKELESGKMKNQRKVLNFKIVDEDKVPREFLVVSEKLIREAILENKADLRKDIDSFKIEGVEIFWDHQTILK